MPYEIRAMYRDENGEDSTTSGPLRVSEREARALFDQDCANLSEGSTLELSDYDTGQVILKREGRHAA